jgi:hypothetical protein
VEWQQCMISKNKIDLVWVRALSKVSCGRVTTNYFLVSLFNYFRIGYLLGDK